MGVGSVNNVIAMFMSALCEVSLVQKIRHNVVPRLCLPCVLCGNEVAEIRHCYSLRKTTCLRLSLI